MIAVARMVRSSDPVESSDLKEPEREQLRGIDPLREIDLSADLLLDALKDPFRALKDPLVPVRRMALRAAGDLLATDPILKPKKGDDDKEKPKEASVDQAKEKAACAVCCENKKDDKKPDPHPVDPDPPTVIVKPNELVVLKPVHFDFDKWDILPESAEILHDVGTTLKNHPEIKKVRVEGHTDVRGKDQYNQTLSEKRMNSVVEHLVATEKVDGGRLQPVGLGESQPKIPNAQNETQHRQNRRVEFHITDGVGVPQSSEIQQQTQGGKPNVEPPKSPATGVPETPGPKPTEKACEPEKTTPAPPPANVEPEVVPPGPQPEEKPKDPVPIVGDEIVVPEIHFKFDKWDLTLESQEILDGVATTIKNHGEIARVNVHGHTDERGPFQYNIDLSDKRVASVVKYLASKGVKAELLAGFGHGWKDPVHKNAKTKEQHRANRRVQFKLELAAVQGQVQPTGEPTSQQQNQGGGTKPKPKPQGGQGGNGAFIKLTPAAYEPGPALSAPAVTADVGGESAAESVDAPVADAPVADAAVVAPAVAPEPVATIAEAPAESDVVAVEEAPEPAVESAPEPGLQATSAAADPNDPSALAEEVDGHPGRPAPEAQVDKAPVKGKDDIKKKRRRGVRQASAMVSRIAPKLGLSPSNVDVRVDDEAQARTAAVNAPGLFADGVVWLDPGMFASDSRFAQHVLAHELAHVAQAALPADGTATRESVEADANRVANALLSGGSIPDVEVPLTGAATFNGAAPAQDEDVPPPPPPAENDVAPAAQAAQAPPLAEEEDPPPPPPEAVDEDEAGEVDADEPLLSFDNDEDVPPPPPPEAEANADHALEEVPPPPPPEVDDAPPPPPPIDPVSAAARARLAYEARIVRLNAIVREKADQLVTVPAAKEQLKNARKLLAECDAALAKAQSATQGNFSKFAGWITRAAADKKAAFEAEKAANVASKRNARNDAQALVDTILAKLAALKTRIETMEAAAGGQAGGLVNKEAEATAILIHDSLDKIFKDREMVANALLGKSRLQIAQTKVAYFDHYHRELIDDLRGAMNRGFAGKLTWKDGSIEEAIAHLGGRAEGAVKALTVAASSLAVINLPGLHHDFNNLPKMEAALWDLDASERATVKQDPKVVALIAGTTRDWKQVISYLLDGDKVRATAVGLHRAMHGAGTDVGGVYRILRRTDVDHVAVAVAFKELYGATVSSWLEGDFSGAELKRAQGLWNVDESGAAPVAGVHSSAASVDRARDLKEARGWFGTDWFNNPKVIVDKLNGMTREDLAEMFVQFGGREKFMDWVGYQLDDKYWQMAESILRKGEATGNFTVSAQTASDVLYDTKDASKVLYLLQGRTKAEIDVIRQEFADFGTTLDAYLMSRFDGIKRHRIAVALQGEPKTPEELVKVAMMRYDFERGGGSNWFSTFWMYVGRKLGMSEAGALMDREWSEIQELTGLGLKATDDEIAAAVGRLGDADKASVAKLGGRIASDAERYREAKDALTKCLVLGTSIAVGSIVTILSAGTLSPFVAGLLGAVAGSGAALGAKKGVQGAAYGASEFKKDAIIEILLAPLKAAFVNVSFFGTIPEGAGPITEMLKILTKDLPGPNWTQELVNIAVSQGLPRLAGPVVKALLAIPVEMFQPDNFVDILTLAKKKADAEQGIQDRGGRG